MADGLPIDATKYPAFAALAEEMVPAVARMRRPLPEVYEIDYQRWAEVLREYSAWAIEWAHKGRLCLAKDMPRPNFLLVGLPVVATGDA